MDDLVVLFDSQQSDQLKPGQVAGKSSMVALHRDKGNIAWRTPLSATRVCYGTPCVYHASDGTRQIVDCNTGEGVFALDPSTGKRLWNLKVFGARCCSSPIIAGDLIIGTSGSGGGGNHLVAVRPGQAPEEVFRLEKAAPYVPTPVVVGQWLFTTSDNGIASCCEADTGRVLWSKRISSTVSASNIVVGKTLLTIDIRGKATLLDAGPEYRQLGQVDLGDEVQATPAFAENHLLLRVGKRLLALAGRT